MKYFKPIALFFFIVCVCLAFSRKIECDELWSYQQTAHSTAGQIVEYLKFRTANNHVINSLYMRFMEVLGVKNIFFYRLLSLVSFIIYSYYYYKIIRYKTNEGQMEDTVPAYYLIVCLFPYVITYFTYFSMARGYAVAIAAFMASLYYFIESQAAFSIRSFLLLVLLGSVASLSLFSFLYPFLVMVVFIVIRNYRRLITGKLYNVRKVVAYLLAATIIALVTLYIYSKGKIINVSDLSIAGGNNLFKNGLLSSLFSFLALQNIASQNYYTTHLLFIIMRYAICLSLCATFIIFYLRRKMPVEHIIFGGTIVLMIVSHLLFHSRYPYGRAISFLIILLYLPLITTFIAARKERFIYNMHFVVLIAIGLYGICSDLLFALRY
jgi:hypothetical protein